MKQCIATPLMNRLPAADLCEPCLLIVQRFERFFATPVTDVPQRDPGSGRTQLVAALLMFWHMCVVFVMEGSHYNEEGFLPQLHWSEDLIAFEEPFLCPLHHSQPSVTAALSVRSGDLAATSSILCMVHSYCSPFRSITDTVLLLKQAAILSPSLFQHTSKMPPRPLYVLTSLPSFTFQMSTILSKEPLARYLRTGPLEMS